MSQQSGTISEAFVKLIDVIREQHKYTIVMELIEGGDLFKWLIKRKVMKQCAEVDIASVFCKVCKGIEALHQRGIVHRDIKLENILV
jgi:serine/threonine protein kinase